MCSNTILQTIDPYNPQGIITRGEEKKRGENLKGSAWPFDLYYNDLFHFVVLEIN